MVRVGGTAFSMLHLAFAQLMFVLALKLRAITGGVDGIGGFRIPPFSIPGLVSIDMKIPSNFYYFAAVVLGLSAFVLWFVTKTPFGSVIVGVRDNPRRVAYLGFRVPNTKAVVYLLSAGFAGVAGMAVVADGWLLLVTAGSAASTGAAIVSARRVSGSRKGLDIDLSTMGTKQFRRAQNGGQ